MTARNINAWVIARECDWEDEGFYMTVQGYAPGEGSGDLYSAPIKISHELPADFNPTAACVSLIEQQKAKALADYQKTVAELNEKLSKLLALRNEVSA